MYNTIKMYLFRLLKSKSFYIILVLIALIAWYNVYHISYAINSGDKYRYLSKEARDSWHMKDYGMLLMGMNVDTGLLINEKDTITVWDEASVLLSSSIIILLTGILIVLFVSEEHSCGYNKNLMSCVKKRRSLIVSKMVAIAVFIAIEFIVLLLITELVSLLCLRQLSHSVTIEQLRYIGVEYVLYIAFASLVMMVTVLLKNAPVSVILNVLLSQGMGNLILFFLYNSFGMLIFKVFQICNLYYYMNLMSHWNQTFIMDYCIFPNIVMMSMNAPAAICIRGILVALITIPIYNSISIAVTEKRDV